MYLNKKEKNPNDLLIFILNKLHEVLKKNTIYDNIEYYGVTTADNKPTIKEGVLSWDKL